MTNALTAPTHEPATINRPAPFTPVEGAAVEEGAALEPVGDPAVPLICLARAWKAEKLLLPLSTALMAKTMPPPQWLA